MPGQLPKALILGVYGAFVRELGGWLAVSHLITLLADLGVDEQAVRSSTSRLKQRGMLEPKRRGGTAGYALTSMALDVLAEGDRHIYADRAPADPEDGWTLVVFSVPETHRDRRHVLRSRLAWLGFGNLSSGVWIAPARLRADLEATLQRLELTAYVDVFESRYTGFEKVQDLVSRAWDLPGLAKQYADFLDAQREVLESWRHTEAVDVGGQTADIDRRAFVDYMNALTQWRRLPFLDPGLPAEVLPGDWPGHAASEVFRALRDLIEPHAAARVRAVAGDARDDG